MSNDPRTENPDDTKARALASLDRALAAAPISAADRVMLRDLVLFAWQEWVAAMQQARIDQIPAARVRVAALLLIQNIFWESVVMTTPEHLIAPVSERLLAQLIGMIRQGHGR